MGHDYLPDFDEDEMEPEPAEEGSVYRKHARARLVEEARQAKAQGASYETWLDRVDQALLDTVTSRDLDTIFHLVWKGKFFGRTEG